jgi:molecular chaperone Hsp33
MVQRLPNDDTAAESLSDDTWKRVVLQAARVEPASLLAPQPAQALIAALFPHDDVRVFRSKPASFGCSCSRERVERALRIAGLEEIESVLAERGDVVVTCEFCNREYSFAPAEARAVFATEALPAGH